MVMVIVSAHIEMYAMLGVLTLMFFMSRVLTGFFVRLL
jgi:hypothetical protein